MHHLDRTLMELESVTDEMEGGDSEYEFLPLGSSEREGDLEADYEGDFEGDFEAEAEGDYEGDYEGDFEAEAEGDYEGDYEGDFEAEAEGDFEGDYEGDFEAEAEGDFEGDYEGDFEAEAEGDFEGDYEGDFEAEAAGDFEGDYEGDFEAEGEGEGDLGAELEGETVFDEVAEMHLAAGLLEVGNDQELEQFIGSILRKAGQALGKAFGTPEGQSLVGALKDVARKALPLAGAAIGNVLMPGVGGMAGAKAGAVAGQIFGLELEGLSPQDQEFEVARRFVRLVGASAAQLAGGPSGGPPDDVAKDAVVHAAYHHAPGLARGARWYRRDGWGGRPGPWGGRRRGRWVRRGRRIILFGV